jgi:hypothetical protein
LENETKPDTKAVNSLNVVDNPDGSKTVKLKHPIKVAGQEQWEIQIRRPKLGDLKVLDQAGLKFGNQGTEIANLGSLVVTAVQRLGDMHPDAAEAIDIEDLKLIAEAMAGFFGMSQLIGNILSGA